MEGCDETVIRDLPAGVKFMADTNSEVLPAQEAGPAYSLRTPNGLVFFFDSEWRLIVDARYGPDGQFIIAAKVFEGSDAQLFIATPFLATSGGFECMISDAILDVEGDNKSGLRCC